MAKQQLFQAHETARADEANGLPLAGFTQRAIGFAVDFVIVALLRKPVESLWKHPEKPKWEHYTHIDLHHFGDLLVPLIYFALALYFGKGRTPGKRVAGTRVLSLEHKELTLWQCVERSLGYGASMLECGFGFAQFFINRNRQCVHDRIAETIVVDTRRLMKLNDQTLPAVTQGTDG